MFRGGCGQCKPLSGTKCHKNGYCELPIPINVFRGSINGVCNKLALQIDHVIAKYNGGDNSKENLKATHRYCNASKNKWQWSEDKKLNAQKLIKDLLEQDLESGWRALKINNTCIIEGCTKVARSGDYWLYCQRHAMENGENIRVKTCGYDNCSTRARKNNYCQKHYKKLFGQHINKCIYKDCDRQIQYKFRGEYCQKHSREMNLIVNEIKPGIKEKAAHARSHNNISSKSCFWCVEYENKANYFDAEEILANIKNKNLTVKAIAKINKISLRAAQCVKEKQNNIHGGDCSYCNYIQDCQRYYLS